MRSVLMRAAEVWWRLSALDLYMQQQRVGPVLVGTELGRETAL